MVVSVMSMSAKNVPTITMIDKITFYCSSGFFNKGMLKIKTITINMIAMIDNAKSKFASCSNGSV